MEETLKKLGQRIKDCRKKIGYTQTDLCEKSGVSIAHLSALERGKMNVSVVILFQLAEALGISMSDLFSDIEEQTSWSVDDVYETSSYQKNVEATCYPPDIKFYEVSNLLQFLVYLPLIQPERLMGNLLRIGGVMEHNETYVLDQINDCISSIPSSSAKEYADAYAKNLSYKEHMKRKEDGTYYNGEKAECHKEYIDQIRRREAIARACRMIGENHDPK